MFYYTLSRHGSAEQKRRFLPPGARGENGVDLTGIGVAQQGRFVRAAPRGGQPGPLQVDAGDPARPHLVGEVLELPDQVGRRGGHQGGDQRGGAVPEVEVDSGGGLRAGRRREGATATAVDVGVDEAGHHGGQAEVVVGPTVGCAGPHCDHGVPRDLDPPGP